MTRKHFTQAAIEFGYVYRNNVRTVDEQILFQAMLNAFCSVARSANENFDKDRFMSFTFDVGEGRRDLDGKKIA